MEVDQDPLPGLNMLHDLLIELGMTLAIAREPAGSGPLPREPDRDAQQVDALAIEALGNGLAEGQLLSVGTNHQEYRRARRRSSVGASQRQEVLEQDRHLLVPNPQVASRSIAIRR